MSENISCRFFSIAIMLLMNGYICVGICNGVTIKITWRNECVREDFLPMYIRPFPMLIKASLFEPWLKSFIKTGPLKFSINIILLQCKRGQFCMHGIFPMVLVAKWHSISRRVETERNPLTKIVLTSFIPKLWQICLIRFSQFLVWLNSEKNYLFVLLRHCLLKNISKSCITFISIFRCFPLFVCLICIISSQCSNERK